MEKKKTWVSIQNVQDCPKDLFHAQTVLKSHSWETTRGFVFSLNWKRLHMLPFKKESIQSLGWLYSLCVLFSIRQAEKCINYSFSLMITMKGCLTNICAWCVSPLDQKGNYAKNKQTCDHSIVFDWISTVCWFISLWYHWYGSIQLANILIYCVRTTEMMACLCLNYL